jgi:hypothetical protein
LRFNPLFNLLTPHKVGVFYFKNIYKKLFRRTFRHHPKLRSNLGVGF